MKVIVVGNGPSLLNHKQGELIDTFTEVVRFNAYSLMGFEEYAGTKTTCWVNTIDYLNKKEEERLKVPYNKIIWHSWQWDPDLDKGYQSFKEHYKDTNMIITKTQRDTILAIQDYIGDKNYFSYSTGIIAIWMYLQEYPKLTITGFDWWKTKRHHYNDNVPRGTLHKPDKEFKVIEKLIKDNKLTFLLP